MIMQINAEEILLSTPEIIKIPGIASANAIGICISGGSPIFGKKSPNPGLNFDIP